jgi:hypothetical protein
MIKVIQQPSDLRHVSSWQHEGLVKAHRLAQRYQQLVRDCLASPAPVRLPAEKSETAWQPQ